MDTISTQRGARPPLKLLEYRYRLLTVPPAVEPRGENRHVYTCAHITRTHTHTRAHDGEQIERAIRTLHIWTPLVETIGNTLEIRSQRRKYLWTATSRCTTLRVHADNVSSPFLIQCIHMYKNKSRGKVFEIRKEEGFRRGACTFLCWLCVGMWEVLGIFTWFAALTARGMHNEMLVFVRALLNLYHLINDNLQFLSYWNIKEIVSRTSSFLFLT